MSHEEKEVSTYFRPPSDYFVLFVCVVAIALFHRFSTAASAPEPVPTLAPAQSSRSQIQSQALEKCVSGAIGIDETRGDSVVVIVRQ